MTAVRVRRLAVRCVAPHGAQARALDARARLARVASGPLAAALDHVLGGVDADVRIASLRVPLDLDPADYDDETLAHLWAARIAAALAPHLPPPAGAGPSPAPPPASSAPTGPVALPADPATWVAALGSLSPEDVAAVAALLVARPGAVAALYAALPATARGAVLAALARAGSSGTSAAPYGTADAARAATAAAAAGSAAPGEVPRAWTAAWEAAAAGATAHPEPERAGVRIVADGAERLAAAPRERTARAARGGFASSVGGLVLLYPWLAAYADAAVAAHPDPAAEDVRRAAYAALVAPEDPLAQHDPLVRLLAGVEPDAATVHAEAEVDGEPVLRAFAGLLAGFEESSPEYLRAHLLRRPAELSDVGDAVLVRLAPMPLDLLLRGLPYPLGVVRLPWTPPVAVELRWR